jgi:hypothetical protein
MHGERNEPGVTGSGEDGREDVENVGEGVGGNTGAFSMSGEYTSSVTGSMK